MSTGRRFRDARLTIGVTQRELARRTGISQSAQSRFERGLHSSIDLAALEVLARALGGRVRLEFELPFLQLRVRQRDHLHARCVGYIARRLEAAGWQVATEVEIDGRFGPGSIDVLAFDPASGTLLVIEVKTELSDFGQIQRTLGWYASRARRAVTARDWRVRSVRPLLLVLATEAADRQLLANRELLDVAFRARAADVTRWVARRADRMTSEMWGLAMVDPHARGRAWLRRTRIDGRRRSNPYMDYADAVRVLEARVPIAVRR